MSRFPHPLALLVGCVLVAAALSYVLPAGRYDRRDDPATGRSVVVAGTYHTVERTPVNLFKALIALPKGMADAGDVIFFVFLAGGAFAVVDKTGALRRGVDWLVGASAGGGVIVIPLCCVLFATAGALENMQEEIIALVPVLLLLTRRLGYDALTACAMSIGAAAVGSAFSPWNPFQVGIAQKLSQVPLGSGWAFRLPFLLIAVALWTAGTLRHAHRTRVTPAADETVAGGRFGSRESAVLAIVALTFVVFIYGVMRLGWDFNQMAALFFAMAVLVGVAGGLGVTGTAEGLVEGFRGMAYAAMLIGVARAVYVVMNEGQIIDTVVYGLFTPVAHLPLALSGLGMMAVQAAVHVPVPSVSGQAVLTMPVLVPLADLLGMPRQVMILTYQFGAGICDLITPTNGAPMAIIAAAGVRYESWFKFLAPRCALLAGLGVVAIVTGIVVHLQ